MIIIETTPNLYGVSIKGDYNDLNELYDSLSRYLGFYCENEESFPYYGYEYLLSLNYDLRHAYQGDRETDIQENNAEQYGNMCQIVYEMDKDTQKHFAEIHKHHRYGNLYFSVNILYPLIFHYINAFEYILNAWYKDEWFSKVPYPYDALSAEKDRSMIALFTSMLWENLAQLFGREECMKMYHYVKQANEYVIPPALYTDAVLHYQLSQFKLLSSEEKKQALILIFYQQIEADFRRKNKAVIAANQQFKASAEVLKASRAKMPMKQNQFFNRLLPISKSEEVSQREFDQLLQSLWPVDEEDKEPDW